MSRYEELHEKANKCRINSINAESAWAKNYWKMVADKLELYAANLPLVKAMEIK